MYYLAKFFELIGMGVLFYCFYIYFPDPMSYELLAYGSSFFIAGWIIEKFLLKG
tara:strand:+ start:2622 stop:2783 length:162 start_codon:yes stop_codon:yes gene_type:complete